jgi:hypothetical protein
VSAFCVAGTDGCPAGGTCDDGNPCTDDARNEDGTCANTAIADESFCTIGAYSGICATGVCILAICDDLNQCTTDEATPRGCRFDPVPDGTVCFVRNDEGSCQRGLCEPNE